MHVPLRMCAVCRKHIPKSDLIRFEVDPQQKAVTVVCRDKVPFGRGVYLCKNEECIKRAQRKHVIERQLKTNVNDDIYIQAIAESI